MGHAMRAILQPNDDLVELREVPHLAAVPCCFTRRLQDRESDTGYDTRRRASEGARAHLSQTTVSDTCGSATTVSAMSVPLNWTAPSSTGGSDITAKEDSP